MSTTEAPAATASRTRLAAELVGGQVRVRSTVASPTDRPALRTATLGRRGREARVAVVPEGALLLAGDHVHLDVQVGPGVRLELVETAGTVAHHMRGGAARWDVTVGLADDAVLQWRGLPFVVADGADVTRTLRAGIAATGRLALAEQLVRGRHGEHGGALRSTTRVDVAGVPLLVEELDDLGRSGVLAGSAVMGSVLLAGARPGPTAPTAHRLDLEGPGCLWRRMGAESHLTGLDEAWVAAAGSALR